MMKLILDVQVDEEFKAAIKRSVLRRVVEETLKSEGVEDRCEVSLVITGNQRIQELNRAYRGLDEPTDVLSFPLVEGAGPGEGEEAFPLAPDGILYLGDIVVSYPYTVKQAEEHGHSPESELKFLIVHGVLHLLGYDDETSQGLKEMIDKANAVLLKLDQS